jgi:hypothetical protein
MGGARTRHLYLGAAILGAVAINALADQAASWFSPPWRDA